MTGAVSKKESIWHLVLHSWGHWLHAAYASLVIASYFIAGALDAKEAKVLIAYISLFVYVLLLLGLLIYTLFTHERYIKHTEFKHRRDVRRADLKYQRELKGQAVVVERLGRKARYAQVVNSIRDANHLLNDAHWYIGGCYRTSTPVNRDALKSYLQPALDKVAEAFNIATGANHRACIKLINRKSGRLVTRTLCRDHASAAVNRDKDRTEGDLHTIEKNTAYSLIIKSKRPHFLCQDIPRCIHYENTSKQQLGDKLPYDACIVVPIRHIPDHQGTTDADSGTDMEVDGDTDTGALTLGFLAVDCKATDVYSEEHDVALAFAFADALFWVLYQWEAIQQFLERPPMEHQVPREISA